MKINKSKIIKQPKTINEMFKIDFDTIPLNLNKKISKLHLDKKDSQ